MPRGNAVLKMDLLKSLCPEFPAYAPVFLVVLLFVFRPCCKVLLKKVRLGEVNSGELRFLCIDY